MKMLRKKVLFFFKLFLRNLTVSKRATIRLIDQKLYNEFISIVIFAFCLNLFFWLYLYFFKASLIYIFPTAFFFLENEHYALDGGWKWKKIGRKKIFFDFSARDPILVFFKKLLAPYPLFFSDYLKIDLLWFKFLEAFLYDFYTISSFSNFFLAFFLALFLRLFFLLRYNYKLYKWVL